MYLGRENAGDHLWVIAEPHSWIRRPDAPNVFDESVTIALA